MKTWIKISFILIIICFAWFLIDLIHAYLMIKEAQKMLIPTYDISNCDPILKTFPQNQGKYYYDKCLELLR